jgi:hypothetical protein
MMTARCTCKFFVHDEYPGRALQYHGRQDFSLALELLSLANGSGFLLVKVH